MNKPLKLLTLICHFVCISFTTYTAAAIRVGYFDVPPYTVDQRGQQGPALLHFQAIAAKLQVEVQFVPCPLPRLLKMLENNELDAGLLMAKSDARLQFLAYPTHPMLYTQPAILVRQPSLTLETIAVDPQFKLAYWQQGHTGDWFAQVRGHKIALTGDDVANRAVDMVVSDKIDGFYAADINLLRYLQHLHPTPADMTILPIGERVGLYTVFSKQGAAKFLQRYEQAFEQVNRVQPLQIGSQ